MYLYYAVWGWPKINKVLRRWHSRTPPVQLKKGISSSALGYGLYDGTGRYIIFWPVSFIRYITCWPLISSLYHLLACLISSLYHLRAYRTSSELHLIMLSAELCQQPLFIVLRLAICFSAVPLLRLPKRPLACYTRSPAVYPVYSRRASGTGLVAI